MSEPDPVMHPSLLARGAGLQSVPQCLGQTTNTDSAHVDRSDGGIPSKNVELCACVLSGCWEAQDGQAMPSISYEDLPDQGKHA